LRSGKEPEVPVGKKDGENVEKEPKSTESKQTLKAREVTKEDKDQPYVPRPP